jgi:hypothetical protein
MPRAFTDVLHAVLTVVVDMLAVWCCPYHCRSVGSKIARFGVPAAFCPLTVVFTGKGNVSLGAQEIFDLLPVRRVRGLASFELWLHVYVGQPVWSWWALQHLCLPCCLCVHWSLGVNGVQVSVQELKTIREGGVTGADFNKVIYVAVATAEDMVEHVGVDGEAAGACALQGGMQTRLAMVCAIVCVLSLPTSYPSLSVG